MPSLQRVDVDKEMQEVASTVQEARKKGEMDITKLAEIEMKMNSIMEQRAQSKWYCFTSYLSHKRDIVVSGLAVLVIRLWNLPHGIYSTASGCLVTSALFISPWFVIIWLFGTLYFRWAFCHGLFAKAKNWWYNRSVFEKAWDGLTVILSLLLVKYFWSRMKRGNNGKKKEEVLMQRRAKLQAQISILQQMLDEDRSTMTLAMHKKCSKKIEDLHAKLRNKEDEIENHTTTQLAPATNALMHLGVMLISICAAWFGNSKRPMELWQTFTNFLKTSNFAWMLFKKKNDQPDQMSCSAYKKNKAGCQYANCLGEQLCEHCSLDEAGHYARVHFTTDELGVKHVVKETLIRKPDLYVQHLLCDLVDLYDNDAPNHIPRWFRDLSATMRKVILEKCIVAGASIDLQQLYQKKYRLVHKDDRWYVVKENVYDDIAAVNRRVRALNKRTSTYPTTRVVLPGQHNVTTSESDSGELVAGVSPDSEPDTVINQTVCKKCFLEGRNMLENCEHMTEECKEDVPRLDAAQIARVRNYVETIGVSEQLVDGLTPTQIQSLKDRKTCATSFYNLVGIQNPSDYAGVEDDASLYDTGVCTVENKGSMSGDLKSVLNQHNLGVLSTIPFHKYILYPTLMLVGLGLIAMGYHLHKKRSIQKLDDTVDDVQVETKKRRKVGVDVSINNETVTVRKGCIHPKSCPLIKEGLVSTDFRQVCDVACGGHHCIHFAECVPSHTAEQVRSSMNSETANSTAQKAILTSSVMDETISMLEQFASHVIQETDQVVEETNIGGGPVLTKDCPIESKGQPCKIKNCVFMHHNAEVEDEGRGARTAHVKRAEAAQKGQEYKPHVRHELDAFQLAAKRKKEHQEQVELKGSYTKAKMFVSYDAADLMKVLGRGFPVLARYFDHGQARFVPVKSREEFRLLQEQQRDVKLLPRSCVAPHNITDIMDKSGPHLPTTQAERNLLKDRIASLADVSPSASIARGTVPGFKVRVDFQQERNMLASIQNREPLNIGTFGAMSKFLERLEDYGNDEAAIANVLNFVDNYYTRDKDKPVMLYHGGDFQDATKNETVILRNNGPRIPREASTTIGKKTSEWISKHVQLATDTPIIRALTDETKPVRPPMITHLSKKEFNRPQEESKYGVWTPLQDIPTANKFQVLEDNTTGEDDTIDETVIPIEEVVDQSIQRPIELTTIVSFNKRTGECVTTDTRNVFAIYWCATNERVGQGRIINGNGISAMHVFDHYPPSETYIVVVGIPNRSFQGYTVQGWVTENKTAIDDVVKIKFTAEDKKYLYTCDTIASEKKEIKCKSPTEGMPVWGIVHTKTGPVMRPGKVIRLRENSGSVRFDHDCDFVSGDSGATIVDQNGHTVGIHKGMYKFKAGNVAVAVTPALKGWINTNELEPKNL